MRTTAEQSSTAAPPPPPAAPPAAPAPAAVAAAAAAITVAAAQQATLPGRVLARGPVLPPIPPLLHTWTLAELQASYAIHRREFLQVMAASTESVRAMYNSVKTLPDSDNCFRFTAPDGLLVHDCHTFESFVNCLLLMTPVKLEAGTHNDDKVDYWGAWSVHVMPSADDSPRFISFDYIHTRLRGSRTNPDECDTDPPLRPPSACRVRFHTRCRAWRPSAPYPSYPYQHPYPNPVHHPSTSATATPTAALQQLPLMVELVVHHPHPATPFDQCDPLLPVPGHATSMPVAIAGRLQVEHTCGAGSST